MKDSPIKRFDDWTMEECKEFAWSLAKVPLYIQLSDDPNLVGVMLHAYNFCDEYLGTLREDGSFEKYLPE